MSAPAVNFGEGLSAPAARVGRALADLALAETELVAELFAPEPAACAVCREPLQACIGCRACEPGARP